jgi:hypothetical protein
MGDGNKERLYGIKDGGSCVIPLSSGELKLPSFATYPHQVAHCELAKFSMHDVDLD